MASNMKAVKLRIRSVQSTMQITKAMELVASSKLRRARDRAITCRPYFEELHQTLVDIADGNTDFTSPYVRTGNNDKICYVVIGGDRGLAGGYNSNLFKHFEAESKDKEKIVFPVGKKVVEYAQRRDYEIMSDQFSHIASVSVSDCFSIANLVCKEFNAGRFGHVALFYTKFVSMMSQTAGSFPILPLNDLTNHDEDAEERKKVRNLILYEPSAEEVFNAIVPEYLAGLIYGAVCESTASELAARRTAMDAATKNAGEMIDQLNLYYNRARQAAITQEITEIVAGSDGV